MQNLVIDHYLWVKKMLRQWSYRDVYFPIDHKSMAYLKMERHIGMYTSHYFLKTLKILILR